MSDPLTPFTPEEVQTIAVLVRHGCMLEGMPGKDAEKIEARLRAALAAPPPEAELREALEWCVDYIEGTCARTMPPLAEPFLSEQMARYRDLLDATPADDRASVLLAPFAAMGGDWAMPAYHDLEADTVVWASAGRYVTAGDVRAARRYLDGAAADEPDYRAAIAAPPPEAALREALLTWFDTTHGNEFGHDHHCPAPWNEQPHTQPIFEGCTCGWSDVQRAEAARAALPVSPAAAKENDVELNKKARLK